MGQTGDSAIPLFKKTLQQLQTNNISGPNFAISLISELLLVIVPKKERTFKFRRGIW